MTVILKGIKMKPHIFHKRIPRYNKVVHQLLCISKITQHTPVGPTNKNCVDISSCTHYIGENLKTFSIRKSAKQN